MKLPSHAGHLEAEVERSSGNWTYSFNLSRSSASAVDATFRIHPSVIFSGPNDEANKREKWGTQGLPPPVHLACSANCGLGFCPINWPHK